MKKIAIVANSTWNIYNFRLSLIKKLKAAGFRVTVIAPVDEYISYLNDSYFTKHVALKRLNPQSKNPLKELLLFWELYRIFKKEQPDLILNYTIKPNIYGNLAARILGIPTISTLTGLGYAFIHNNWSNRLVKPLYHLALKSAKMIVFHNQDDLQLFKKLQIIDSKKGMVISGSGVNTNHFRPLPAQASKKFIFLFVGRLLSDKGIIEFAKAARQVRQIAKNAECWVVGQLNSNNPAAVEKNTLLEWIEHKEIRYFGDSKDIRAYLKQADVFVLPSYREGMPRAILEAMSMAKPIITTDTPGCRDTVIDNSNGYLVPIKDSNALAEAMIKMYQHSDEKLEAMGNLSRELVLQNFDEKIITSKYLQLIETILSKKTKKPVRW